MRDSLIKVDDLGGTDILPLARTPQAAGTHKQPSEGQLLNYLRLFHFFPSQNVNSTEEVSEQALGYLFMYAVICLFHGGSTHPETCDSVLWQFQCLPFPDLRSRSESGAPPAQEAMARILFQLTVAR